MADAVSNQREIERRQISWNSLTTLNDGVTSLGWDDDPNDVVDGNTPGESWLYSLPVGQFYKQSNATLWWKTGSPNTWQQVGVGVAGGDVTKVGTPADNQVGVWTGDGTIEGTSGLTYDGAALAVTGNITVTGTVDGIDIATDVAANTLKVTNATHSGDVTGSGALTIANDAVTYAKMQNVVADDVLLGNTAGAGGPVAELSATAVRSLLNVEDGADVTDATNVDAAGATMNADTSLVGNSYFLDEDNMVSNDATKVASQQSIVAYVTSKISSAKAYKGGYDADANSPDLDVSPSSSINSGDVYDVTVAGTFFTTAVEVGDMLTAKQDAPTTAAHWVITQTNLTAASIKSQYESNADTNAYTNAEKTKVGHISITQAVDLDTLESNVSTNNSKVTNATHSGDVTGSTELTIASGAVDIAMLSATGTPGSTTFLRGDNTWSVPAGSGDVSKVGTPVDNQVGVWTGDGTLEGTSGLTYSGTALDITGNITLSGTVDGIDIATDVAANTLKVTNATHSGDVTGSGALTIANDAVTYAKMQNVVADNRILGNVSGAGGIVAELTASDVRTMINVADGATAVTVSDVAYDDTSWNANTDAATKNAIRDKINLMDTAIGLNTGKVTNATHSGDATGATALTLANAAITGKDTVTAVGTDYVLLSDTSDSGNLKKALVSDMLGSSTNPGGSDGQIQYNNSSAFGGTAGAYWDDVNDIFVVGPSDYGDAYSGGQELQIQSTANARMLISSYGNQASGSSISFVKSRGTFASPATVVVDDVVMALGTAVSTSSNFHATGSISCVVTGTVTATVAPTSLLFKTNDTATAAERFRITDVGSLTTGGETAPDVAPGGICLNTGNTAPFISFKNSTVAHPFTSIRETDTVMMQGLATATEGGALFRGFSESTTIPLKFEGYQQTGTTGDASGGAITLIGKKSDGGTGATSYADTENCISVFNDATGIAFIKGSGDLHLAGGVKVGAYDQADAAGAIEWNGSSFRGYTGSAWIDFGTPTPAGANTQIQYNNGGALGADANFVWNATSEFLGIGTTTPAWKVDARTSAAENAIIGARCWNSSGYSAMFVLHSGRGSEGAANALVDTSPIGQIYFQGQYNSSSARKGALLVVRAEENWGVSNGGAGFEFETTAIGSTTATKKFTMTGGGDFQLASGGLLVNAYQAADAAGAIEWNGSNFRGYTGSAWVNLDTQGGTTAPGGSDGQIQYNNGSAFGGTAGAYWDDGNDIFVVGPSTYATAYDSGENVQIHSTSNSRLLLSTYGNQASGSAIIFNKFRGTFASPAGVIAGDTPFSLASIVKTSASLHAASSIVCKVTGTVTSTAAPTDLIFNTNAGDTATEKFRITGPGVLTTGAELYPDTASGGMCLNTGSDTSPFITLKNSTVAHGFTSINETDTVCLFGLASGTAGGTIIRSFSEASTTPALWFDAYQTSAENRDGSPGAINFVVNKSDGGTSSAALAVDENIATFQNGSVVKLVVKGSGDLICDAGMELGAFGQTATSGAVEWNGTNFRGYNGSAWVHLDKGNSPIYTLTYGASLAPDFNNGPIQKVTLTGSPDFDAPSNLQDGAVYRIILIQDGSGSRTIADWSTDYHWENGTWPTLSTAAGAVDIVTMISTGSVVYCSLQHDFKSYTPA